MESSLNGTKNSFLPRWASYKNITVASVSLRVSKALWNYHKKKRARRKGWEKRKYFQVQRSNRLSRGGGAGRQRKKRGQVKSMQDAEKERNKELENNRE